MAKLYTVIMDDNRDTVTIFRVRLRTKHGWFGVFVTIAFFSCKFIPSCRHFQNRPSVVSNEYDYTKTALLLSSKKWSPRGMAREHRPPLVRIQLNRDSRLFPSLQSSLLTLFNLQTECFRWLLEDGQRHPPGVIDKENILTVIAPRRNMMRDIRDHNACCSGHNAKK